MPPCRGKTADPLTSHGTPTSTRATLHFHPLQPISLGHRARRRALEALGVSAPRPTPRVQHHSPRLVPRTLGRHGIQVQRRVPHRQTQGQGGRQAQTNAERTGVAGQGGRRRGGMSANGQARPPPTHPYTEDRCTALPHPYTDDRCTPAGCVPGPPAGTSPGATPCVAEYSPAHSPGQLSTRGGVVAPRPATSLARAGEPWGRVKWCGRVARCGHRRGRRGVSDPN